MGPYEGRRGSRHQWTKSTGPQLILFPRLHAPKLANLIPNFLCEQILETNKHHYPLRCFWSCWLDYFFCLRNTFLIYETLIHSFLTSLYYQKSVSSLSLCVPYLFSPWCLLWIPQAEGGAITLFSLQRCWKRGNNYFLNNTLCIFGGSYGIPF